MVLPSCAVALGQVIENSLEVFVSGDTLTTDSVGN